MEFTETVNCPICGELVVIYISYISATDCNEFIFIKDRPVTVANCKHNNEKLIIDIYNCYELQIRRPR